MCISLSRTYIQNFSNMACFLAVPAWCGAQRVDPQMIHFELFYHLLRRSQFNPQTIFVHFRQLKKNIFSAFIYER